MFTSPTGLPAYLVLPSYRSVLNHVVRHSIALSAIPACCVTSRLRHFSAGSPLYSAETGSSSYGLTVRLWLLPTPPRDDAVTFSYGAVAHSGRDFHPANSTHSRAYIGVENGFHRPLPPNPVCSSPATGSPVSCFLIGIGAPIYGLLTS